MTWVLSQVPNGLRAAIAISLSAKAVMGLLWGFAEIETPKAIDTIRRMSVTGFEVSEVTLLAIRVNRSAARRRLDL